MTHPVTTTVTGGDGGVMTVLSDLARLINSMMETATDKGKSGKSFL
jgi:hypothetical protein